MISGSTVIMFYLVPTAGQELITQGTMFLVSEYVVLFCTNKVVKEWLFKHIEDSEFIV